MSQQLYVGALLHSLVLDPSVRALLMCAGLHCRDCLVEHWPDYRDEELTWREGPCCVCGWPTASYFMPGNWRLRTGTDAP